MTLAQTPSLVSAAPSAFRLEAAQTSELNSNFKIKKRPGGKYEKHNTHGIPLDCFMSAPPALPALPSTFWASRFLVAGPWNLECAALGANDALSLPPQGCAAPVGPGHAPARGPVPAPAAAAAPGHADGLPRPGPCEMERRSPWVTPSKTTQSALDTLAHNPGRSKRPDLRAVL